MSINQRDKSTRAQCIANNICEKKKFQKNFENKLNFFEIITNEKYYRIENIDELQQVLNEITSSKTLVNMKKINEDIRSIFVNKSKIFYLNYRETHFNNKYKYDEAFKQQLCEIVDALKKAINNDAIKEKKILTI